jgi:ornithine cyclodeaminase
MQIRILSAAEVKQALPMSVAIEAMRRLTASFPPTRPMFPAHPPANRPGAVLLMRAFLRLSRELGINLISMCRDNPARNLPMLTAMVLVLDPDTGQPLALLNGATLTAIRTGAGGGLAADLLARPDAKVVAVFGAGVQARTQLEAVCVVRQISEVRIFDRAPLAVEKFAQEIRQWPNPPAVVVGGSRRAVVAGADIVITATTSDKPVFDGRYLSPGTHVTGIGSYTPQMQEVDEVTVQRAKIVVDSLKACLAEAGDLLIPLEKNLISKLDLHGEIGAIVNGQLPGRESAEEITFFKSVGVAVQDAVAAAVALHNAEALGLGTLVEF